MAAWVRGGRSGPSGVSRVPSISNAISLYIFSLPESGRPGPVGPWGGQCGENRRRDHELNGCMGGAAFDWRLSTVPALPNAISLYIFSLPESGRPALWGPWGGRSVKKIAAGITS